MANIVFGVGAGADTVMLPPFACSGFIIDIIITARADPSLPAGPFVHTMNSHPVHRLNAYILTPTPSSLSHHSSTPTSPPSNVATSPTSAAATNSNANSASSATNATTLASNLTPPGISIPSSSRPPPCPPVLSPRAAASLSNRDNSFWNLLRWSWRGMRVS